jgi:hypothetical protein
MAISSFSKAKEKKRKRRDYWELLEQENKHIP